VVLTLTENCLIRSLCETKACLKTVLTGLLTIPFGCCLSQGAGFTADFNSGFARWQRLVVLPSFIDTSGGVG